MDITSSCHKETSTANIVSDSFLYLQHGPFLLFHTNYAGCTATTCNSLSISVEGTLVARFGTFGRGMLVYWKYPVPATGSGSIGLDFHQQADVQLHVRPHYGSNVSSQPPCVYHIC